MAISKTTPTVTEDKNGCFTNDTSNDAKTSNKMEEINNLSEERCDLNILLKDDWRHKIVPRDDGTEYKTSVITTKLPNEVHFSAEHPDHHFALLLAGHLAVKAFGYGSCTVLADLSKDGYLLPTILTHKNLQNATCATAMADLSTQMAQGDLLPSKTVIGSGQFDVGIESVQDSHEGSEKQRVPLMLSVDERGNLGLSYAIDLFNPKSIQGFLGVTAGILSQVVTNVLSDQPDALHISDIELLSQQDKDQLHRWNATDGEFPEPMRLDHLFDAAAAKSPEATAVVFKDTRFTYHEVMQISSRIAALLHQNVIQTGDVVALFIEKTDLVVMTMLGVWKAGAAFLPIDISYPKTRVEFMVRNSGAKAILVTEQSAKNLPRESCNGLTAGVINIDAVKSHGTDIDFKNIEQLKSSSVKPSSSDLAYITYTSGTTGEPKGVAKVHKSVVNSITDLSERYNMASGDPGTQRVLLYASYVFEPFIRQLLIALINSHVLVVLPDEVRSDYEEFPALLSREKITYLNITGSILNHYRLPYLPNLKRLHLVGEELTQSGLENLRSWFNGTITNEYAFTESAFVTAVKMFEPGENTRQDRSIGLPLRNVKWYVLNEDLQLLPAGAVGELFIGGMGVASGYVNRPELTGTRFLENPFASKADQTRGTNLTLYRTGDLARQLPSGEMEYMGRSDFQLKISGVRVEPGEIEAIATRLPGVKTCVVVPVRPHENVIQLVGFYVCEQTASVTENEISAYLQSHLISAMVPKSMYRLDRLPVNINGKADRKKLQQLHLAGDSDITATNGTEEDGSENDANIVFLKKVCATLLNMPIESLSEKDDFFRLGGDSLSSALLCAEVRKHGYLLTTGDLFRLRTLQSIANHISQSARLVEENSCLRSADMFKGPFNGRLEAFGIRQSLLYRFIKEGRKSDIYMMQQLYRLQYSVNVGAIKQAWSNAVETFPGLRARFEWNDVAEMIIEPMINPDEYWAFEDCSDQDPERARKHVESDSINQDRQKPFDLTVGPLLRVKLFKIHDEEYMMLISCHHIIADGWSLQILLDFVLHQYLNIVSPKKASATQKTPEDSAFVLSQQYWHDHLSDNIKYWEDKLGDVGDRADISGLLKTGKKHINIAMHDAVATHGELQLKISKELSGQLRRFCSANDITLHSLIQFVWHKTLHTFGGGDTTVVGTVTSGRDLPINDISQSVGLYINTLPVAVNHAATTAAVLSITDAILQIQKDVIELNEHSIIDPRDLQKAAGQRGLFDCLLAFENYEQLCSCSIEGCECHSLKPQFVADNDKVDHPLAIVVYDTESNLVHKIWYDQEIFDVDMLETFCKTAEFFMEQIANESFSHVNELKLCNASASNQLQAWNNNNSYFDHTATLIGIFEAIVEQWPDNRALTFRKTHMTYVALNSLAESLALQIRASAGNGTLKNKFVTLVLDKNEMTIASILAVWKAGGAFVPVDPKASQERISLIIKDTESVAVITNSHHVEMIKQGENLDATVLVIEEMVKVLTPGSCGNDCLPKATDLAYAIYTSGTTGVPKAVLVEHRGVVNLQTQLAKLLRLNRASGNQEVFLSFSNYVFDHFVEQMTDALLNGQTLVVLDDELRHDEDGLIDYIVQNEVTYLSGTPSVLSLYDLSRARTLRTVDAIGEDLNPAAFKKIRSGFSGILINGYGPTEVSITSHKRIYRPSEWRNDKSIGTAIKNIKCYVVNKEMQVLPPGAVGELCLGGAGVARGYHKREELTAEKFVSDPFCNPAHMTFGRMYRTGDLARWTKGGEIEYLGRTDQQVKINGHRVELGEVHSALATYPGILSSAVIFRDIFNDNSPGKSKRVLIGYYVAETVIEEDDVKKWIRGKCSSNLVPKRIVQTESIPVTPSGKLDTKNLPDVSLNAQSAENTAAISLTPLALQLRKIWAKVLQIPETNISNQDSFFSLGGDSILAIQLAQISKKELTGSKDFSVAFVFKHQTIEEQEEAMVGAVDKSQTGAKMKSAKPKSTTHPLTQMQQKIMFVDDFEQGTAAYNIQNCLVVGAVNEIANWTKSIQNLIERHEALRTVIEKAQGSKVGKCCRILAPEDAIKQFKPNLHMVANTDELDRKLEQLSLHIFSLESEIPVQVHYVVAENVVYASFVFHHIAFDGWSWNIFHNELQQLLDGMPAGHLTLVTKAYWTFAEELEKATSSGEEEEDFWAEYLAGSSPAMFPVGKVRPARFDYHGKEVHFTVDTAVTRSLVQLASSEGVSLSSLLLTAYGLTLETFSGEMDFVVGVPFANRCTPDLNSTIGFFSQVLPVRVSCTPKNTLADQIELVHASFMEAISNGESYSRQTDSAGKLTISTVLALQTPSNKNKSVLTPYQPRFKTVMTKFDTTAFMTFDGKDLGGIFTYCASLYQSEEASSFVNTFTHILSSLTASLTSPVLSIPRCHPLSSPTQNLALSDTPLEDAAETASQIFEKVVEKCGSKIAIATETGDWTYNQLQTCSSAIAALISRSIDQTLLESTNDATIALMLNKSPMTVAAILAIWKLGVAYVPIDPDMPTERINYILSDSAPLAIVTSENTTTKAVETFTYSQQVITIPGNVVDHTDNGLDVAKKSSGGSPVAYMIYTSGTTGRPKAVAVQHSSLLSFLMAVTKILSWDRSNQECVLYTSNYTFDFSIEQFCLSILSGQTLLIPTTSESIWSERFYEFANRKQLTYLSGTPTCIHRMSLAGMKYLKRVLVAGESFKHHHFNRIRAEYHGLLHSAYGTTETTIYNSVLTFNPKAPYADALGKPMGNSQFYVLGSHSPVRLPACAIGELYIGGACLAKGYHNKQRLNKEKFLVIPEIGLVYKTGDLVKVSAVDGSLRFMGRNDRQVKINGMRIEVEEIESMICKLAAVQDCAVVAKLQQGTTPKLVAYIVQKTDSSKISLLNEVLLSQLRERLPSHMVPQNVVRLEAMPRMRSGKVDTSQLPDQMEETSKRSPELPTNELEEQLLLLWQQHTGNNALGVVDSFFVGGGDSIGAMMLTSRLQQSYPSYKITVRQIFDHPSVRSFAEKLRSNGENKTAVDFERKSRKEIDFQNIPLTPIQQWFQSVDLKAPSHFNHVFGIKTRKLDCNRLKNAIYQLTKIHDAFKLRFDFEAEKQFYAQDVIEPKLHILSEDDEGLNETLERLQGSFDIKHGLLFAAAYIDGYSDGSARIWFAMHHLIVDTVSWQIIKNDLKSLYEGTDLAARTSFAEYATAIREYTPSLEETTLWKKTAHDIVVLPKPPLVGEAQHVQFTLGENDTQILRNGVHKTVDTDLPDILLTSLAHALRGLTGQDKNYITMEGHGRSRTASLPDTHGTVGWFTTMYPMPLTASEDFLADCSQNHNTRKSIPNDGIGYGLVQGVPGTSSAPLPPYSFNYLGAVSGSGAESSEAWQLDQSMCGISKAKANEDANKSIIDITAFCSSDQLVCRVDSSRLSRDRVETFATRMEESLLLVASQYRVNVAPERPLNNLVAEYYIINEEGTETVFVFPPGEGGAESYMNNIAKVMTPSVKLVLFDNIHRIRPFKSFEAIADAYLKTLQTVHSTGPYNLLGWSFGGVVALQIATQLTLAGKHVKTLSLIDSYFDVKKASAAIGLAKDDDILDPINYYYAPPKQQLAGLANTHVTLFKAAEMNGICSDERQHRLFDYYRRTRFNGLDALLPEEHISLISLTGNDHHNWVKNPRQVEKMALEVERAVFQNNDNSQTEITKQTFQELKRDKAMLQKAQSIEEYAGIRRSRRLFSG